MLRATAILRRPDVRPQDVVDTLTLDHGGRHRRRVTLTADGGLSFLLDLDRAAVLDDGDAVRLQDGRLVLIRAAPERLVEIRARSALELKRIIWHLGNRHVPVEITEDAVYITPDHVLAAMVRGLGATTALVERPFRPEAGAYGEEARPHPHGHAHHPPHGGCRDHG